MARSFLVASLICTIRDRSHAYEYTRSASPNWRENRGVVQPALKACSSCAEIFAGYALHPSFDLHSHTACSCDRCRQRLSVLLATSSVVRRLDLGC